MALRIWLTSLHIAFGLGGNCEQVMCENLAASLPALLHASLKTGQGEYTMLYQGSALKTNVLVYYFNKMDKAIGQCN